MTEEDDDDNNIIQLTPRLPKAEVEKILRQKWKTSLDTGFTVVPSVLLRSLPSLGIEANELAVLVILIDLWWKPGDMPWPSKAKLAKLLGVSEKTIQRSIKKLVDAGLILSESRFRGHGGQTSNRYDLRPLVARLEAATKALKEAESKAERERSRAVRSTAPKKATSKEA